MASILATTFGEHLDVPNTHYCQGCDDMLNIADTRWRFTGESWEHRCGSDAQAAGYYPAVPVYVSVKQPDVGKCIVEFQQLSNLIQSAIECGEMGEIVIQRVKITPEEVVSLPEFEGI